MSRARRPARKRKITPKQIRRAVQDAYDERQAAWTANLLLAHEPDWTYLFGLHLHMRELEAMLAGMEEQR